MSETGLRARKTARTRDQLAQFAMRAFLERGYDSTTLEDIAEAAEVHKRTLLRYFPTKTHLVLHGHHSSLAAFRAAVEQRGKTPILDLWEAHVIEGSQGMMRAGPLANTRKIAASEPAVRQAFLDIQARYQRIIAAELAKDLGRDPENDILTKVAAAALVGGNYAVGAMIMQSESYAELQTAELEVVRLVRESLLKGAWKMSPGGA